ncbi:DUF3231 family protein [Metabacillus sediminilitoris]|uniref:DUF3231 family protein n=1 Tax=Metabacillus sediminilitoris TaxID=2567941 RepID=A0A4S4BKF6_9BACI|nr:DUF3231 family protein [Metabacillus sediminilitoris]QGQ45849.1 DUF3231 family protein [Metabacillus sediminilitoris]THF75210.1 DUF3231 family protein [Metabacillus sediminilitoris]
MMDNTKNVNGKLTSAEMGKLWTTYTGNTLSKCVLSYYLQHIDDQDIKKVVENALNLSEKIVENIKEIFMKDNFPIPIGFTDEDVNLTAPRLFLDDFYLHYLKYTCKAGMSIYSIAIPIMTREDIREFFINIFNSTVNLITEINDLLIAKGLYIKPPQIPTPEKVDFIRKQNYLNGFFGNIRSLHALEITHLYDNIENNVTSRALLIGFSQVAKTEEIQKFFLRGVEMTNKQIEAYAQQLHKENLPSHPLLDDLVSISTISPFSDKLMLWHKIEMFSMRIRSIANAISLNGRKDIAKMYTEFHLDIGLYVEDAANIMIDHGWMEQPPKAINREDLAKG